MSKLRVHFGEGKAKCRSVTGVGHPAWCPDPRLSTSWGEVTCKVCLRDRGAPIGEPVTPSVGDFVVVTAVLRVSREDCTMRRLRVAQTARVGFVAGRASVGDRWSVDRGSHEEPARARNMKRMTVLRVRFNEWGREFYVHPDDVYSIGADGDA